MATTSASEDDLALLGMPDLPGIPDVSALAWDTAVTLRAWGGYNDNPQLSAVRPVGSSFVAGAGDLLIYRIPYDGRELTFFGLLEHIAYLDERIDAESVAAAEARFRRYWDDGTSAGVALEYLYLNQVFDASELEGVPAIVRAEGHTLSVRPGVAATVGPSWAVDLELEASRQWLADPLDDFFDLGPKLTLTRRWNRGRVDASYQFRVREFDSRVALDDFGSAEDLTFHQHEFEVEWIQRWGARERWRTTLEAGFLRSLENGDGFYDFDRVHAAALLRYEAPRWEVQADARWRWYRFPDQIVGPGASSRRRSDLSVSVRGEWKFEHGFRVFAEYGVESSDENVLAADYRVEVVSAGVSLEL